MSVIYSRAQLHLIGRALLDYHRFGSGVPNHAIAWPKIVSDVLIYTDLEIEELGGANDPETLQKNKTSMRLAGERFRQFAKSATSGNRAERVREIREVPYIVEFLSHPEIGLLSAEALASPDVSLAPARRPFSTADAST